jgi:hypothetical protein
MVVGGFGVAAGIQTPICSVMIVIISDTDLRLALALAEGLADHVTGGQCGHYR